MFPAASAEAAANLSLPSMKRFFDAELDLLRSHLIDMGQKAVEQVRRALRALEDRDVVLAQQVRDLDDELDQLEVAIDAEVVSYITLRAPVARELRLVIVGMKASHDLERIGDEANSIAKRVQRIAAENPSPLHPDIPVLARKAIQQVQDAIDSFLRMDDLQAVGICQRDKEIDKLHKQVTRQLAAQIREYPEQVTSLLELAFVVRSIERIADHAVNIAEEVIFLLRGKDIRHDKALLREMGAGAVPAGSEAPPL